jgi:putative ABC transport system ATP-binding protein
MTAAVQVRALRHTWPGASTPTLIIDALDVDAGQTLFLRGPSGSGKSTLLALLAGVLVADGGNGEVRLLDASWRTMSAAQRDRHRADHLGYIFQQFNLLPYLSVIDNVRLPCRFSARRRQRAGSGAAERLLERMGMDASLWHRAAGVLSVGQQQRVAAARALIGAPEVVLADEPTSALDEDLRDAFMTLLLERCAEAGSALVFVSHDARLAPRFARRVDLTTLNAAATVAA